MDRIGHEIDRDHGPLERPDHPVLSLGDAEERLIEQSKRHLAVPEDLLRLNELDVLYDAELEALWTYMRPEGRPSFNPAMLSDFEAWQRLIGANFGPDKVPLRFLVLGSRAPGVFCFGGDLDLFHRLIRDGNRVALKEYGYRCVEILFRNLHSLDLPMLTIGLVEGAALGGGFEALLSFDYIVAERGATFGFPEIMFGLFPGMGAHALLSRKIGTAMADRLIVSNETYTAEQMFELGLVHRLADPGEGLSACRDFITKSDRKHAGLVAARKAMKISAGLTLDELKRIVDLWAETALKLREQDLKVMSRLTAAQSRLADAA